MERDDDQRIDALLRTYADAPTPALRDELLRTFDWLAIRSARRFSDRGEPFDDLVQVARMGLVKALQRFDPNTGVPFGGFATPTVVGELRRHFRDHTWSVHVPRRAKDVRASVNDTVQRLYGDLGRSPTAREVATTLELSEDLVLEALEANHAYRADSLDSMLVERAGDDVAIDRLADTAQVRWLLDRLPTRERAILEMRFFEELTQSQIAERIGTSQVHVGRLIVSSLARLRSVMEAEGSESESVAG